MIKIISGTVEGIMYMHGLLAKYMLRLYYGNHQYYHHSLFLYVVCVKYVVGLPCFDDDDNENEG